MRIVSVSNGSSCLKEGLASEELDSRKLGELCSEDSVNKQTRVIRKNDEEVLYGDHHHLLS